MNDVITSHGIRLRFEDRLTIDTRLSDFGRRSARSNDPESISS
jgi:hypothetical protein